MIYRLLRVLLRHTLRVFFRSIELEGLEHVPKTGPLLLAANHPNTLLDVLLVATSLDRKVGSVAKAPLFKNPLARAILTFLGAVPIHRRQDGLSGDAAQKNRDALASCEQAVADGQAILIFPEGVSVPDRRLKKLKTGLARIALGAEERAPGQVTIVPVSLVYDDPETFRSRARIRFEPPIHVQRFAALATEPDDFTPVRALTDALRASLEEGVLHIDDAENDPFVRDLDRLYGAAIEDRAGGRLAATAAIARAVNAFSASDPARVDAVKRDLARYTEALNAAGADDWSVRGTAVGGAPSMAVVYLLLAPIALWGALNHAVFYNLPRLVLRLVRDDGYAAPIKILVGLLGFAATYAVQGAAVFFLAQAHPDLFPQVAEVRTPWTPTLIYLGTLPLCGVITLLWWDGLIAWRVRARARVKRARLAPETLAALQAQRAAIVATLEGAQAEYLAAREAATEEEDREAPF